MASVFKQQWTGRDEQGRPRVHKSAKWYIDYRDADGIRRRVPGYKDKAATMQLAAKLEREAEQRKAGLIDRYAEHRKRPLAGHLAEWQQAMLAKGRTKQHANLSHNRVKRVLNGCGFKTWSDLSASRAQAFVAELQKCGLSVQSANFYLAACKAFCSWGVRDGRAPENPLIGLRGGNVQTDRRHERRELSADEAARLLETARTGPASYGMTGADRTMLYRIALETGLRAGELRSLTWRSFELDADPPTVTVEAGYSKHRRRDVLPLRMDTAEAIAQWRGPIEVVDAAGAVFPAMPDRTADMIRGDLRSAKARWIRETPDPKERRKRRADEFLAVRDGAGRVADFHALRHTFISSLARGGVHPKIAQQLARHSTITLTMDRYNAYRVARSCNSARRPAQPEAQTRATATAGDGNGW